ncbi:MAG: hypothetical protein AB1631_06360 [Acidobacteriota bacterium]
MRVFRMIACVALSLSLSLTAIAQSNKPQEATKTTEQKKAKGELEKKAMALVEEIIKELSSLHLPENRILVQATLGDLLWKHDEKRARMFFKQSLDQLSEISGKDKVETSPMKALQSNLIDQSRSQLRQEVVQMVARRDARMARDFLRGIRQNNSDTRSHGGSYDETSSQEINLASQILQTDPKEAFEIAQEHLEKGFHQGLIQLLLQLRAKDAQLGDRLADAVVKKIRSVNLSEDYPAASFALMLLRSVLHPGEDEDEEDAPRAPKPATALALDEKTIQELMSLVVNAALERPASDPKKEVEDDEEPGAFLLMELESMIKDVEKYVPARAAALKARIAEISEDEDPEEKKAAELESVMESGSPEAMLEAAAKASDEMRDNLYQQAAMKAYADGNADKAKQIISEHISDPDRRDQMITYFTQQEIWRAANEGKIEQTRQLMADLSAEQRPVVLAQLAATIAQKGDKKIAAQLLNEAREMIGGQASNFLELITLLEIARVYNSVEWAKGFEIVDPIVDQLNVLLGAAAVLDGFELNRHFKDGEMLPYSSSMLMGMARMCAKNNGLLARSDFDRAKATADRFQRSDMRILARLAIAQCSLSDATENESLSFLFGSFYRGMIH